MDKWREGRDKERFSSFFQHHGRTDGWLGWRIDLVLLGRKKRMRQGGGKEASKKHSVDRQAEVFF